MELGRRSRERPAGRGEQLGPALLGGERGAQLQAPPRGPGWAHPRRLWSSQWEAEVLGGEGGGSSQDGISSGWDQGVDGQQAPMPHVGNHTGGTPMPKSCLLEAILTPPPSCRRDPSPGTHHVYIMEWLFPSSSSLPQ